ncbi:diguanylate cyclase [Sphingomonas sp. CL5.1]|uniref:GGDEF domain-containing protein n=1 Tax=Sphingomonas sp. CL5.1 TaxID=2653203 RepID=UPI001582DD0E|nr:diguanylate cyclase [Sphingomonas sp. CL5.1]QKR98223.1 diguanylate cyclase [Sphingomonas sp. CL5.1]
MPGRTALKWIYAALAALAALLATVPAEAAGAGLVGTPIATCVSPVRPGDTATAMLRADARYDCVRDQESFGAGDYWVRSAPLSTRAATVRTASVWQDDATLYIAYADGVVLRQRMDGHDATHAIRLGAIFERTLPQRAAPVTRLLWHVRGSMNLRGIVIAPRLATEAQSAASDLLLGALYSAFGGLSLSLLVYNFALWGALRHRFQLAYCVLVAGMMLYAFSSSGAMAWVFSGLENNERLRINYVMVSVSTISVLAFARSFFEPAVFRGWVAWATDLAMAALGIAATAFAVLAPWHFHLLDRIHAISFVIAIAVVPVILWSAWRERSNYLWLFVVSWAAPIVLAGMRVAENFHVIAWSFLLDNSTLLSMTAEALLSSLAIAYRFRLIAIERDDARARASAAWQLADADPLTGLLNRRGFLRAAVGRAQPHLLVLADIDHFKLVNDALGHDGGDEVLRIIARALRAAAPPDALVARLGGEEFAVLVPERRGDVAAEVLARVRRERMPFDLTVTVSLGTCAGPIASEQDWKALYRNADQALYAAKAAGRDRVRHAAGPLAA